MGLRQVPFCNIYIIIYMDTLALTVGGYAVTLNKARNNRHKKTRLRSEEF